MTPKAQNCIMNRFTRTTTSIIFALIGLMMCACQGQRMRNELHRIDSLNQANAQLDTVTVVPELVRWFDRWGSDNERMTACYLMGRVYYDSHDLPRAIHWYLKAIDAADTTAKDCDFRRLSRIYGQMTVAYHDTRLPRQEIMASRKATDYAQRAGDSVSQWIFYSRQADAYHMLNQMDSSLYYSQQATAALQKMGQIHLASGLLGEQFSIMLRWQKYDEAQKLLDNYMKFSGLCDEHGEVTKGREIYYVYRGNCYFGQGKSDSAEYYYHKALSQSSATINAKENAYKGLMLLYRQRRQADSIAKYALLFCQYNDSASFTHSANELVRAQATYNYEKSEKEAARASLIAWRYKVGILLMVFAFVIGAYILYQMVKRHRREAKQKLHAAYEEYRKLTEQYQQAKDDLASLQADKHNFIAKKEQEIAQLQERMMEYKTIGASEKWNGEPSPLQNPLVCQLHDMAKKTQTATTRQWEELEEMANMQLASMVSMLQNSSISLTPQEHAVCILTRLEFSPAEQSILLGVSKQRITNLRSQINEKIFNDKSSKTLKRNLIMAERENRQ